MAYTKTVLKPLPFCDATFMDGFWKEKEKLIEEKTLQEVYERMYDDKNSVSFKNFHIIADKTNDTYKGSTYWGDGDCYKWIEAAIYIWAKHNNKRLKDIIDYEIESIAACQEENGYIHTYIQMTPEAQPFTIKMYHEDYNFGHLFTLGARAKVLMNNDLIYTVALKAAQLLYQNFILGNHTTSHFGWNPSHIMGLMDLYRVSGDPQQLELAQWFVADKGAHGVMYESGTNPSMEGFACGDGDQNQERTPLVQETAPEGHAVTATYLYAGATDIISEKDDDAMKKALETISERLNNRRVYITGGVGTYHFGFSGHRDPVHEAFAKDWELPATTAYNETCANIGNAMWSWRMYLLTGKGKYADQLENIMYNSGISGMSCDGTSFRYTNPTKWRGKHQELDSNDSLERWHNFGCYCCPPQVVRTLASMNQFIATQSDNTLCFVLYADAHIDTVINNKSIKIRETTAMPWDGKVIFTIEEDIKDFNLKLRIPSWSLQTTVRFKHQETTCNPGSDFVLSTSFQKGDTIELNLDLRVRKIKSHHFVEASNNHMAFKRGPIVYCLESIDTDGEAAFDGLSIQTKETFVPVMKKDFLGGLTVLQGKAHIEKESEDLYSIIDESPEREKEIQLIPYFAWNNRGIGEMEVWIPRR